MYELKISMKGGNWKHFQFNTLQAAQEWISKLIQEGWNTWVLTDPQGRVKEYGHYN